MSTQPGHILVVDDNDALRENIQEALLLEGFQVSVASSGSAALARLAAEPIPDAVVLDLMMPGMDGAELLARIRADARLREVRVVVTTGLSGPRARAAASPDAFLLKPFGVDELLSALRKAGLAA